MDCKGFGIIAMSVVGSQFQEAARHLFLFAREVLAKEMMWPHPDVSLSFDWHAVWRAA
jgi:hypothetical protein